MAEFLKFIIELEKQIENYENYGQRKSFFGAHNEDFKLKLFEKVKCKLTEAEFNHKKQLFNLPRANRVSWPHNSPTHSSGDKCGYRSITTFERTCNWSSELTFVAGGSW
jgi:hypothetical protein